MQIVTLQVFVGWNSVFVTSFQVTLIIEKYILNSYVLDCDFKLLVKYP